MVSTLLGVRFAACGDSRQTWFLDRVSDWREHEASSEGVAVEEGGQVLKDATEGVWTSKWHEWSDQIGSA